MGHHPKHTPTHGQPLTTLQAPTHGYEQYRHRSGPQHPRNPARHTAWRLTPGLGRPRLTALEVTSWATPGSHANDTPCHHRLLHLAAPTPGREPIRPVSHKAQRATAAHTCPNQAGPCPRHPTGQQQRPHLLAKLPEARPGTTTTRSIAPRSQPLNPQYPAGHRH